MLSDILICIVLLVFTFFGLARPYIALCAVIWVDILKPQNISFGFLAGKPLSLIVTAIFFISLFLNAKKINAPVVKYPSVIFGFFLFWITLATYNAQFQAEAWWKYDFVIKTLIFPFLIPFVLDSKVKIDTFVATIVAALSYFIMIGGMRTFLGAGGYGQKLVYSSDGDGGITESSTLSMVAVLVLPLIYYFYKNSVFVGRIPYLKFLMCCFAFAAVLTTIGTYARTGLVGLFVLGIMIFIKSKQKLKIGFGLCLVILIVVPFMSSDWLGRMDTIGEADKDTSAFGRVVVWRWTLDYVSERPLMGGGFVAYKANSGELQEYFEADETNIKDRTTGKDFHNIYFQVLGELGYVGLIIYLLIIYFCYKLNKMTIKNNKEGWAVSLAKSLNLSLFVYCACGMFIGVAYTPWLFYFLGVATSIHNVKKS